MKKLEKKLVKAVVTVAVPGWKVGDVVEVMSDDPRIGKGLEVKA